MYLTTVAEHQPSKPQHPPTALPASSLSRCLAASHLQSAQPEAVFRDTSLSL